MGIDIDVDIARWILDFLVRQPLDDRLVSSLINILPTNENSSLKKSLLLRRIESEISTGTVSEKILDFLDQIEELDFQDKIKQHSDLIKAAFCSVAVACTVKFMHEKGADGKFMYFDAVRRIWRGRVCKMEKEEKAGLISEELTSWKDELEAAVWDESTWDNLLQKCNGLDAVVAVRLYVQEEKDNMGPSFLELVAEALRADNKLKGLLGLNATDEWALQTSGHPRDANRVVQRANVVPRQKYVVPKRALSGTPRGAKSTDDDSSGADISAKICGLPSTPEVAQVHEALKSSSLELKAMVKDPLPDALNIAVNVLSSVARKDAGKLPVGGKNNFRTNHSAAESNGAVQANEDTVHSQCPEHQNDAPQSPEHQKGAPGASLLACSSTAHTYEWDEPNDALIDASPNTGDGVVSPLKIKNLKRRRAIKRWRTLEEETLRIGVDEYGRGNWKVILNAYRHVFDERTEVDLKDKWRNLKR